MTNPIIPWIGGKRRLVDLLLKRFPAHSCYVELFAGGAAVYFARHPADVEVLNDVNGDLVNLYRVVTHHLEEFVRQFKWALTSRQVFKWLQETRPEALSAAHLRLAGGTYVEQLDWSACIDRYDRPHTLFYADPPYWETEGYGVPFAWEQYEQMAARLKTIKGKAVVSINDHPAIRECFKDFEMEALKLDYTVGGGANRVERGELIIYSWERSSEPAGLF